MRLLVLGDFSRDPEPLTQGSDIRAHYISTELETEGFKVERVSRDLVPHSRTARRQLARLPVLIRHSDAVLIVGIPRRLLIYRLLTRLQAGRIPIILDFNDDPILQSIALGERSIPHESGTKRMIDEIVRCSSLVVFVSESMRSFYLNLWRERNLNPQMDTLVVPNASDPSHFAPSPVPKEPTLGYVGGLAVGRGFEMLVKAVEILRSEGRPVRLRIGVSMSDATNVSRNSGLKPRSWIEFVTGVNFQTVPQFLQSVRICTIPHPRKIYYDFALPVKLFDYMAARRPVLATSNTEQARLLERTRAGLITEPSPESFAKGAADLLDDLDLCERMGAAGRDAVETDCNWSKSVKPLADRLISTLLAQ
jgi:glycosyltransferase involved in cell wall biosynthesis